MQGGTFTITNGGIYGSLMSTPILNAPQSGILGMHKIQDRPVAIGGKVEIRPMMYLALSYDHRVIDGKDAVTFLVRVKESLEDPATSGAGSVRCGLMPIGSPSTQTLYARLASMVPACGHSVDSPTCVGLAHDPEKREPVFSEQTRSVCPGDHAQPGIEIMNPIYLVGS